MKFEIDEREIQSLLNQALTRRIELAVSTVGSDIDQAVRDSLKRRVFGESSSILDSAIDFALEHAVREAFVEALEVSGFNKRLKDKCVELLTDEDLVYKIAVDKIRSAL